MVANNLTADFIGNHADPSSFRPPGVRRCSGIGRGRHSWCRGALDVRSGAGRVIRNFLRISALGRDLEKMLIGRKLRMRA